MELPFRLTKLAADGLAKHFGLINFTCADSATYNEHGYVKVVQYIFRETVFRMLKGKVGEIGGRVNPPADQLHKILHTCVGNFNARDQCRILNDIAMAFKQPVYGPIPPETTNVIVRNQTVSTCIGDAVDCLIQSDELFFDNSLYDMNPEILCRIMRNKRTTRTLATMLFDHRMLTDDRGRNEGFTWRTVGKNVIVSPGNNGSEPYVHNIDVLRCWMKGGYFQYGGYPICWRVVQSQGYMALIEATLLTFGHVNKICNFFINHEFIKISGPSVHRILGIVDFFYIEREFFDSLVAKGATGATLEDIIKFARTKRSILVINNTIVNTETKATAQQMIMLSTLALREAEFVKAVMADVDTSLISGPRIYRAVCSTGFKKVMARLGWLPSKYIMDEVHDIVKSYTITHSPDEFISLDIRTCYQNTVVRRSSLDELVAMYGSDCHDVTTLSLTESNDSRLNVAVVADMFNVDPVSVQWTKDFLFGKVSKKKGLISLLIEETGSVRYVDACLVIEQVKIMKPKWFDNTYMINSTDPAYYHAIRADDKNVDYWYNVSGNLEDNTVNLVSTSYPEDVNHFSKGFVWVCDDLSIYSQVDIARLFSYLVNAESFCLRLNSSFKYRRELYNVLIGFSKVKFFSLSASVDSTEFYVYAETKKVDMVLSIRLIYTMRLYFRFGASRTTGYDHVGREFRTKFMLKEPELTSEGGVANDATTEEVAVEDPKLVFGDNCLCCGGTVCFLVPVCKEIIDQSVKSEENKRKLFNESCDVNGVMCKMNNGKFSPDVNVDVAFKRLVSRLSYLRFNGLRSRELDSRLVHTLFEVKENSVDFYTNFYFSKYDNVIRLPRDDDDKGEMNFDVCDLPMFLESNEEEFYFEFVETGRTTRVTESQTCLSEDTFFSKCYSYLFGFVENIFTDDGDTPSTDDTLETPDDDLYDVIDETVRVDDSSKDNFAEPVNGSSSTAIEGVSEVAEVDVKPTGSVVNIDEVVCVYDEPTNRFIDHVKDQLKLINERRNETIVKLMKKDIDSFDKPLKLPVNVVKVNGAVLIKRAMDYFEAENRLIDSAVNSIVSSEGKEMGTDTCKFSETSVTPEGNVKLSPGTYKAYYYWINKCVRVRVEKVKLPTGEITRISDKLCYGKKIYVLRFGADVLKSINLSYTIGHQTSKRLLKAGVPGEGKTHAIVQSLHDSGEPTLVIAKSNSAVNEIRQRIVSHNGKVKDGETSVFGKSPINIPFSQVITFSAALSGELYNKFTFGRVIMDEVTQAMAGEIEAICRLYKCKTLIAYGDTQQCAFVAKALPPSDKDSFMNCFDDIDWNFTTRRCPINIASKLSYFYGGNEVKTTSSLPGEIKIMELDRNINVKDYDLIMVASNEEEGWVEGAITVAKAQGRSVKRTLVIDTKSAYTQVMWNTPNIVLVAMTRHTESVTIMHGGRNTDLLKFAKYVMGEGGEVFKTPIGIEEKVNETQVIACLERFPSNKYVAADADEYIRMQKRDDNKNAMSLKAQKEIIKMHNDILAVVKRDMSIDETVYDNAYISEKDRPNIKEDVKKISLDLHQLVQMTSECLNGKAGALMEASASVLLESAVDQEYEIQTSGHVKMNLDEDVRIVDVTQLDDDFITAAGIFQPCNKTVLTSATARILEVPENFDGDIVNAIEISNKWIETCMAKDCSVWNGSISIEDAKISLQKLGKSELTALHKSVMEYGLSLTPENHCLLRFACKDKLKAKVDGSGTKDLGKTQLIEYQDKHSNFIATTLARSFVRWITNNYREGVAIAPAWCDEEFSAFFSQHQVNFNEELNLDFSKFDRSIKITLLMSFLLTLIRLGFNKEVIIMQWSYLKTKITTDGHISFRIFAQVMSGLWCTLFGNSMINSMAYVAAGMFTICDVGVFVGDDGRVLTNYRNRRMAKLSYINEVLGMEVKDIDLGCGYLCGRLFINTSEGECAVFGDIGRMTEKLLAGRKAGTDEELILAIKTATYQLRKYPDCVEAYATAIQKIYDRDLRSVNRYLAN